MLKTIDLLLAYLHERAADISRYSIAVGYGYDMAEAQEYRALVLERLRGEYGEVALPVYQIGATIGVHTGPIRLALALWKKPCFKERLESCERRNRHLACLTNRDEGT